MSLTVAGAANSILFSPVAAWKASCPMVSSPLLKIIFSTAGAALKASLRMRFVVGSVA